MADLKTELQKAAKSKEIDESVANNIAEAMAEAGFKTIEKDPEPAKTAELKTGEAAKK